MPILNKNLPKLPFKIFKKKYVSTLLHKTDIFGIILIIVLEQCHFKLLKYRNNYRSIVWPLFYNICLQVPQKMWEPQQYGPAKKSNKKSYGLML
ncbi:unnamed protein product [Callosobruchus maculatus]|uniref:Uncharacterized protein n=1 Tax=Callosobruchus maculatus TaxID=64391 RepID=A0A653D2X2_CALMS|nr:unnamed protein product [Callosobruchus maculatus]